MGREAPERDAGGSTAGGAGGRNDGGDKGLVEAALFPRRDRSDDLGMRGRKDVGRGVGSTIAAMTASDDRLRGEGGVPTARGPAGKSVSLSSSSSSDLDALETGDEAKERE